MTTLLEAWSGAQKRLKAAGVDSPSIDARLLLEAAADVTRLEVISDPYRQLTDAQAERFAGFVERRARREPVARILGRKGFWKLLLQVDAHVLTPRPETERVVDIALEAFPETARFAMLDLGVGSGAILLSVLAERPGARGLGVDVSEAALAVARDNAANLGLIDRASFLRTDWTAGLPDQGFDLVVSNPPYIPSGDIDGLEPEVSAHEPRLALDGGPDGLDCYRVLAPEILRVLKDGGAFVVEIGWDQAEPVQALFRDAGAEAVRLVRDLSDRDRVVAGRKKSLGITDASR